MASILSSLVAHWRATPHQGEVQLRRRGSNQTQVYGRLWLLQDRTEIKVVDQIETRCTSCGTKITAKILEGDPDYLLTSTNGAESIFFRKARPLPLSKAFR